LDLFQPDDGFYEYSTVVANETTSERSVWHFMAGRGGHEKTLGEIKQSVAFATVPTNDEGVNSTWQLLSALTHKLVRDFQVATGLAPHHRKAPQADVPMALPIPENAALHDAGASGPNRTPEWSPATPTGRLDDDPTQNQAARRSARRLIRARLPSKRREAVTGRG
jgi:hypothetical protein